MTELQLEQAMSEVMKRFERKSEKLQNELEQTLTLLVTDAQIGGLPNAAIQNCIDKADQYLDQQIAMIDGAEV